MFMKLDLLQNAEIVVSLSVAIGVEPMTSAWRRCRVAGSTTSTGEYVQVVFQYYVSL